jgi:hypothetical protein
MIAKEKSQDTIPMWDPVWDNAAGGNTRGYDNL